MQTMHSVVVSIHLSKDELVRYYRGSVKTVCAKDIHGKTIHFPLNILHSFIHHDGIHGMFEIGFDGQGRFESIRRYK